MILSEEKLQAIADTAVFSRHGAYYLVRRTAVTQDAQTRQDTLREVGEWLDDYQTLKVDAFIKKYGESAGLRNFIEVLKRGEMPEQSGT